LTANSASKVGENLSSKFYRKSFKKSSQACRDFRRETFGLCGISSLLEVAMGKQLLSIYETLLAHYGAPAWWPARTPFEVMVGAVLTQNTAWGNVEKAIANFGEDLSPEAVLNADLAALAETIRPAGFFHQKAGYLKSVTAWYAHYDCDVPTVRREPLSKLRAELLSTKGVGQETADSILLYAFGFPTFVVDAYTVRLCGRYPIEVGKGYAAVKAYFEDRLPQSAEIYNNFHALIVINAKEHCRKKPVCEGCPLGETCGR
jgi:endonuclease-3 related protein